MYITLTSIRIRHLHDYFRLSWYGLKITLQSRKQAGFVTMKNTGFGYHHYTASAWESREDLKNFARSGAHLHAMQQSKSLSTAISTYTYEGDTLPDWKTVKQMLKENGKILSFE